MDKRRTVLTIALACAALTAPGSRPGTSLHGRILGPIDRDGLGGAHVRLGPRGERTRTDGAFDLQIPPGARSWLPTRFDARGYSPYRSWTEAGVETVRDVYLFPATEVSLQNHDGPVSPETLREHFDFVYRDPLWTDPRQRMGHLERWVERPVVLIDTRVIEEREDPEWSWVAREKVSGRARRHVRTAIRTAIGPLTGGFMKGVRIRFRRMREGEVVARDIYDVYPDGVLRVSFTTSGYYKSGGGMRLEGDTAVSGHVLLDVGSVLSGDSQRSDYLTVHELGHALGMFHPMEGTHGFTATPLCSIMGGCNGIRRPLGVIWQADRVIARLAYSRMPGNDQRDRDPRPHSEAAATTGRGPGRLLVFHVPTTLLPAAPDLAVRFAR